MQKTEIILSVFHNGQFFAALFERSDEAGYSVSQRLFAANPSDAEILAFILDEYYSLDFGRAANGEGKKMPAVRNPKRRQREAAKAVKNAGVSTKAQEAMSRRREEEKAQSSSERAENKKQSTDLKYSLRAARKKEKHRGR